MNRSNVFFLVIVLLVTGNILMSQVADGWEFSKSRNGIDIFTSKSETSDFKAFMARMTITGTIESFVAVLQDIDGLPDWGYNIKSSRLLVQAGDTIQIYWAEASVPYPFSNRDGVYRNTFRWDRQSRQLKVDINLLPDYIEVKENLVRVKGNGDWLVKTMTNGRLDITFRMEVDPGGGIPAWLVNTFIEDTPYVTMVNIREMINKTKYQGKRFGFIR